ncbi:MAG: T9SS type A sorting domain-containing protein [candidate division Zixibacteria bacterium]|nr:T9SS type A sorting domain-containing protein [candidate division Zixibacteria bacterium]
MKYYKFYFILIIATLFSVTMIYGQAPEVEWERLLGDTLAPDYGLGAFQTSDGGYIVGGNSTGWNGGYYDNVLFKLNADGDTLWSASNRTDSFQENASCFRLMPNGTYMFSGYSNQNPDAGTAYLYNAESDGSYGWTSLHGTDSIPETATCVAPAGDTAYVAMTRFWFNSQYGWDMKLRYIWLDGWPAWIEHYYSEVADEPACINSISTNGYIVTGMTQNPEYYDYELLLFKIGYFGGIEEWNRIGGSSDDYGKWVVETSDGGFLATGYTKELDGNTKDVYIVKTDSACHPEWYRIYGFDYHDEGRYCAQTADGGYIVGATCKAFESFDFWLLRLDANGDTLWTKVIERELDQSLYSVDITDDGGYLICGNSGIIGGNYDMYVVKLGPETGVEDDDSKLPNQTSLMKNYPNPFNASTTINFAIDKAQHVSFKVYDLMGREIETLINARLEAGHHSIDYNASGLPSGIYFYKLETEWLAEAKKMILLK